MNRQEIKELAKTKIKGNKWNILWPVLAMSLVVGIIETVFGLTPTITVNQVTGEMAANMSAKVLIGTIILSLLSAIYMVAYNRYLINFVRTGKFDFHDILNAFKERWLTIIAATFLMSLLITLGSIVIIPGIILTYAYGMVQYLVVDTELGAIDCLKKSREMMRGHKWELFVLMISFIGWIFLLPFTLGILAIWLIPYYTVTLCIYYDRLKGMSK